MKKAMRLGDVCKLLELQPYVLRYWETEFPMLRAEDGGGANRVFAEPEVALLRRIKTLLYDEGYTIAGARKKLESEPGGGAEVSLFDDPGTTDSETPEPVARLDTPNDERIETLRRGVAAALDEARAILALLDARR